MLTEQEEEMIKAMEAKVKEYEAMLEEALADKKSFGKVLAGPFVHDDKKYYRVSVGSDVTMVGCPEDSMIDGTPIPAVLDLDTEVVIVGQAIACIVPEELKVIIETPTFDLITWEEIGGMKSQIHDIREAIETPLLNTKLAEELGVTAIAGIILYGPPGCGKTYIAKAIGSTIIGKTTVEPEAFVYMKGGEMLSKWVGEAENNIKRAFAGCREYTRRTGNKAIMFIDEAEAIVPRRGSRKSSDVETTIVPTFLAEMSGLEGDNPIVILATNHKDSIDDAILREGRIDIKIEITRPTESDAKEIFMIHLKKVKTHDKPEDLANHATEALFACHAAKNVSGAMIETITKDAIRKTMSRLIASPKDKERGVTLTDITNAIISINTSYATKA